MQSFGDRFISQRSAEEDMSELFGTKVELFSSPTKSPEKNNQDVDMQDDSQ